MVDHIFTIPALQRPAFEAVLLPAAKALTVAKFDRKARRTRERMHPTSILERHTKSLADRKVHFDVETDGMGSLYLYGAADTLQAIYNRVSDAAVSLQGPGEDRTLTQLRTDVTTDLLLDGITPGGLGAGIHASVNITVPVLTLLGKSEEPGDLEGYGPIDPDTARRLAGTAKSFTRILTHAETGATLSVGKDQYKVPKDLKRWLRIRDETCRFPGCSRAAKRCDLDHTLDWQFNGATCSTNLAYLCPRHHRLKHQTAWSVKQGLDGTLHWTSPGGKPYATDPATRIRPKPGSKPAPEPTPEWPVDPPPF